MGRRERRRGIKRGMRRDWLREKCVRKSEQKKIFLENFLIKNVFEFSENSFSCSRRMGNAYKWGVERGGKGGFVVTMRIVMGMRRRVNRGAAERKRGWDMAQHS